MCLSQKLLQATSVLFLREKKSCFFIQSSQQQDTKTPPNLNSKIIRCFFFKITPGPPFLF